MTAFRPAPSPCLFTFGATLEAEHLPGETVYSLRSEAPILVLNNQGGTAACELAAETEALLAELHSELKLPDQLFLQRLVAVRPFDLYRSVLTTILERFRQSSALRQVHHDLATIVRHEQAWLAEEGRGQPEAVPLRELLG